MLSDVTIAPADTGMGGLRTVDVVEAYGLEGITGKPLTDPLGNDLGAGWQVTESALQLKSGYRWASLYGTLATLGYGENTEVENDNGPLTATQIRLFVPGDVSLNRAAIHRLKLVPLVARLEDNHGVRRLVGTALQPIRLQKVDYDTQLEATGRRGTLLTFGGDLTSPAPALV